MCIADVLGAVEAACRYSLSMVTLAMNRLQGKTSEVILMALDIMHMAVERYQALCTGCFSSGDPFVAAQQLAAVSL